MPINPFLRWPVDVGPIATPRPVPPLSPNCCIVTLLNQSSIQSIVALGHSLQRISEIRPRAIALMTSPIRSDSLSTVQTFFTIVNATGSFTYPEMAFWTLADCSPVVAVSPIGVFNRPVDRLCAAAPFGAISKVDDILAFDTSLMVLNPSEPLTNISGRFKSFSEFAQEQFMDWHVLPPDLSVDTLDHEYLDFWLRFGTPVYIHFGKDVFDGAVKAQLNQSKPLLRIIQRIVSDAVAAHPDVFLSQKARE
jgi:hypothetical protein